MLDVIRIPATVLVVDPDEAARAALVTGLGELGCQGVVQCADATEAWRLAGEQPFELVVMAWELPGLGGLALFNRLRRAPETSEVPVLVHSRLVHPRDFELF